MRHLKRFVKAISVLGVRNGVVVYFFYVYHRLFRRQKWTPKEVSLATVSMPIWIRPGVSDWIVMERIFLDQEYDPISEQHDRAMDQLLDSIVSSGKRPLIIDCGANIGLSSIWLSERFPEARIVAIEPEPENYKVLKMNTINFPNIVPMNVAVSDRVSRVSLFNAEDTPWAWTTQEADDGAVATVAISDLIDGNYEFVPFIVKIDIEGFEVSLFREKVEWVAALPLMIFEMHDWMVPWSGSGHSFFSVLSQHKRDYLIQGENVFSYLHDALLPMPDSHGNDPTAMEHEKASDS